MPEATPVQEIDDATRLAAIRNLEQLALAQRSAAGVLRETQARTREAEDAYLAADEALGKAWRAFNATVPSSYPVTTPRAATPTTLSEAERAVWMMAYKLERDSYGSPMELSHDVVRAMLVRSRAAADEAVAAYRACGAGGQAKP